MKSRSSWSPPCRTWRRRWGCIGSVRILNIETFFSDQQSRSFHLHKSHLGDPIRLTRLLIASCVAYLWLVYLGVCALRDGWLKRLHWQERCALSLFRLGLRLLALPEGGYPDPSRLAGASRSPEPAGSEVDETCRLVSTNFLYGSESEDSFR